MADLKYEMDNRTEKEYKEAIEKGWEEEDKIKKSLQRILSKKGFKIEFNGKDKNRVYQTTSKKISSDADFRIYNDKKEIFLEYKNSYTEIDFLSPKENECIVHSTNLLISSFNRLYHE